MMEKPKVVFLHVPTWFGFWRVYVEHFDRTVAYFWEEHEARSYTNWRNGFND